MDDDDQRNRTTGSKVPYVPSFSGSSTMNNTFPSVYNSSCNWIHLDSFLAQGQDFLQRNIGQAQSATASGPHGFDDLFGSKVFRIIFLFLIVLI